MRILKKIMVVSTLATVLMVGSVTAFAETDNKIREMARSQEETDNKVREMANETRIFDVILETFEGISIFKIF